MSSQKQSLLITLEYPPDIGGIATYYKQIVDNDANLYAVRLETDEWILPWLDFLRPVKQKIKELDIESLQVGHVLPLGYIALYYKKRLGIPYIVYIHGLDVLQGSLSWWKKRWIKTILNQAEKIVTNSNFVKERTEKKYNLDANKFLVKYPTIDLEFIEEQVAQLPVAEHLTNFKTILSVGRLVKRKGFDIVLEALANLDVEDWRYWIIGEGPDRKRLRSIVKSYNLDRKVKFLGNIAGPRLYQYYNACDIFIMPSREINGDVEGFGIVFLEAAALGKPVIGGRSGGIPEAIIDGQTGILVNPREMHEIRDAIEKLLTDHALARRLGLQGYERVKTKFSVSKKNMPRQSTSSTFS